MRPIRALIPVIRKTSPLILAREFAWQNWKPVRRKRLMSQLRRDGSPVRFRNLPYFREGAPAVGPESCAAAIGIADLVCEGRFPFVSYDTATLGLPPKWNVDFVSGREWPMEPIERLTLVRFDGSDVKVPWELSRLQLLPVLAKAHRISSNERYRRTIRDLLQNWIESNPVGTGPNWGIAMESALRAVSICLALNLLWPLRAEEQGWLSKVTRSLWEHLLFTEAHIEFSNVVRSNHYLSNIVGLLCLSGFLEGPGMEARRRRYARQVQQEMFRQVLPDGGDYEASTGYHLLVTQMFTTAYRVMRGFGSNILPEFAARLATMYDFMSGVADERGCMPAIGDCDDGRVELLSEDLRQMLHVPVAQRHVLGVSGQLGIGQALFGASYPTATSDDAFWYPKEPAMAEPYARRNLEVFPDFGIGIARAGGAELLLLALKNGIGGRGSHTHNDKLSVILRLDGKQILCDAGTGVYTRAPEIRNRFRSTEMHNTVVVSGQEQNLIDLNQKFLFCIGDEASVTPIKASELAGVMVMSASHHGYQRFGVTHERRTSLSEKHLVMEDLIDGAGDHDFALHYHVPGQSMVAPIEPSGREVKCRISGANPVRLSIEADSELELFIVPEQISNAYGSVASPACHIAVKGRAPAPFSIRTTMEWERP